MTGDLLLVKECHMWIAGRLLDAFWEGLFAMQRPVIAIGGPSGSGKSVISWSMAKLACMTTAKIISMDDFYLTLPDDRAKWRDANGLDAVGRGEIDWPKLHAVVQAFRDAKACIIPCVDLLTNKIDWLTVDFAQYGMLIIDGIYACDVVTADLCIFLDVPFESTLEAQKIRRKEVLDQKRRDIMHREYAEAQATKPNANIVLDRHALNLMAEFDPDRVHSASEPSEIPSSITSF